MPSVYLVADYPEQRSTDNLRGAVEELPWATDVYMGWAIVLRCFHVGVNRVQHAELGLSTYSLL